MRIVAFIEERDVISKILSHIGESSEAPILTSFQGPPEWEEQYYEESPDEFSEEFAWE